MKKLLYVLPLLIMSGQALAFDKDDEGKEVSSAQNAEFFAEIKAAITSKDNHTDLQIYKVGIMTDPALAKMQDDQGNTLLHFAAENNTKEDNLMDITRTLIEAKADAKTKNNAGDSALEIANKRASDDVSSEAYYTYLQYGIVENKPKSDDLNKSGYCIIL